MSIASDIKSVIEGYDDGAIPVPNKIFSFQSGNEGMNNLEADNVTYPAVFLSEPITSDDTLTQGGALLEAYAIEIAFLNEVDVDSTSDEHRAVIDVMRDWRYKFVAAMTKKGYAVRNMRTLDIMNMFDANLSGVLVTATFSKPFTSSDGSVGGYCE